MRTTSRLARRALGLAALTLALTGCLKLSQDLTLNADDTVDGEITLAVSKQLLELSGQSEEEAISSITEGDTPLPEGVEFETEPYDDGDFVGQTFVFSGAPLASFSGEGTDELSIVHEGDTFVVSGSLDLSQGSEGIDPDDPTTQQLLESFDVRISVTFPGAVESANGEIDGKTVTWRPEFGENLELSAVGSAIDSGGGGGALLWILIGAAVVVVVVLLVVLLSRRGTGSGGAEAAPAGIGFSPPGEAAAAAGAIGAPPAPIQPPATPTPVETEHAPPPPMPSDTAPTYGERTSESTPTRAPEPEPSADTGSSDTGSSDTGSSDTGSSDTGSSDTGSSDTGSSDTGSSDTGSSDTAD
jgi:hypothetical protein